MNKEYKDDQENKYNNENIQLSFENIDEIDNNNNNNNNNNHIMVRRKNSDSSESQMDINVSDNEF
jgi:hypothetical protein